MARRLTRADNHKFGRARFRMEKRESSRLESRPHYKVWPRIGWDLDPQREVELEGQKIVLIAESMKVTARDD